MSELSQVIDEKFTVALDAYAGGKESILFDTAQLEEVSYEIIALDSLSGPDSRCFIARYSVGSEELRLNGRQVVAIGTEIPRTMGDTRQFEELPKEALTDVGHPFIITIDGEDYAIQGINLPSEWQSVAGLTRILATMRVAERIPKLTTA